MGPSHEEGSTCVENFEQIKIKKAKSKKHLQNIVLEIRWPKDDENKGIFQQSSKARQNRFPYADLMFFHKSTIYCCQDLKTNVKLR